VINPEKKIGFFEQKNYQNKETGAKWKLKNTEVIIMNLENFSENFMIFG
jgi:hypothetical protein